MNQNSYNAADYIKNEANLYFDYLSKIDIVAQIWLFTMVVIIMILSLFFVVKKPLLTSMMLLMSLLLGTFGPVGLKFTLDNYLRETQTELVAMKKMKFTNSIMVVGKMSNKSKNYFKICDVDINVHKKAQNPIKKMISIIQPLKQSTMRIKKQLDSNSSSQFQIVFNDFDYEGDVDVAFRSVCY